MLSTLLLIAIAFSEVTIIDPLGLIRARANTNSNVKVVVEVKSGGVDNFELASTSGETQVVTKETADNKVTFNNVAPGEWRIKGEGGAIVKVTIKK